MGKWDKVRTEFLAVQRSTGRGQISPSSSLFRRRKLLLSLFSCVLCRTVVTMSTAPNPKTVKDVLSHSFVKEYSAYLRSTGKVWGAVCSSVGA